MIDLLLAAALAAGTDPATAVSDTTAATSWLSLVDAKRWDDSWTAAGSLFRSRMPQLRWASTIQPVRDPLGAVASRSVVEVTKAKSLPGAPDGDYEIVRFDTRFANKASATETVVLSREDGGWKVDGYFIR